MSFNRKTASAGQSAQETGYTFEPRYPSGEGIGATITVRGPESARVRALLRQQLLKVQQRDLEARRVRRDPEPATIEQMEADAIDLAVAYTITWSGFEDDGQPLEPTEANLRTIYAECSWIRRQVIDEAQDLGNFVRKPSASSSSTPVASSLST